MSADTLIDARELFAVVEGLTETKLRQLIKDGLPVAQSRPKRLFDFEAVASWLVENGKGEPVDPEAGEEPDDVVFDTIADLAQAMGVTARTIAVWQADPDFPGRPGARGTRTGYYPFRRIAEWRAKKQRGEDESDPERKRLQARSERERIETELKRLQLHRELEQLLDADEVAKFMQHVIGSAVAMLSEIPSQIGEATAASVGAIRARMGELLADHMRRSGADEGTILAATEKLDHLAGSALGDLARRNEEEAQRAVEAALKALDELIEGDADERQNELIDEEDLAAAEMEGEADG